MNQMRILLYLYAYELYVIWETYIWILNDAPYFIIVLLLFNLRQLINCIEMSVEYIYK